ncbi:MAG: nucleoside triphosphate pyrophosphohydrolase [Candidatus Andersenbacteria bacterium]
MKYNKLVRDKIPEYIQRKGHKPEYHIADEPEYWDKLKEKLLEEVQEFNDDESLAEFADVLEVLDAIRRYKKFDQQEIERIKNEKAQERGIFQKRIILEES